MVEPPAASIAVEGGDPVVGDLGSFTWQDGGSDGPWIPGTPIRVGSDERLTLALGAPVDVETWNASYVPAAELSGSTPIGLGQGKGRLIAFEAPPAGHWSMSVDIWFADGLGSASYYWLIEVD